MERSLLYDRKIPGKEKRASRPKMPMGSDLSKRPDSHITLGKLSMRHPLSVNVRANPEHYNNRRTAEIQTTTPLTRRPSREPQSSGKGTLWGGTSREARRREARRRM